MTLIGRQGQEKEQIQGVERDHVLVSQLGETELNERIPQGKLAVRQQMPLQDTQGIVNHDHIPVVERLVLEEQLQEGDDRQKKQQNQDQEISSVG